MHSTQCLECMRYEKDWKCDAFPKGIPKEIYTGEHDHNNAYPGDKGIRFKSLKEFLKADNENTNQVSV